MIYEDKSINRIKPNHIIYIHICVCVQVSSIHLVQPIHMRNLAPDPSLYVASSLEDRVNSCSFEWGLPPNDFSNFGWENCSWAWTCFPRKNRLYSTVFRTSDFEAQEYSTMCIYVHVFGLKTYWERLGGWQPGPGSHCHNRGVAPSFDANGQKTSCALAMKNEYEYEYE